MIEIPLGVHRPWAWHVGYVAIVDEEDADLAQMSWSVKIVNSAATPLVYARTELRLADGSKRKVPMHRYIWERLNGPVPAGHEIDHVEHGRFGGLDNRRSNLRLCTRRNNSANSRRHSNNTSGFKGVHFVRRIGRWQALIRVNGVRRHLGYFDTAAEGGAAYDAAARLYFGAFAKPNTSEVVQC